MRNGLRHFALIAVVGIFLSGDLLACGDKFLMSGRGTRYQRPKNARAASVLIYANPASGLPKALRDVPVDAVMKTGGHRATTVETFEQLSTILAGGRFDVIIASSSVAGSVSQLLGGAPDAAVIVPVDGPPKDRSLLKSIDKAVAQRDQNARKAQRRS